MKKVRMVLCILALLFGIGFLASCQDGEQTGSQNITGTFYCTEARVVLTDADGQTTEETFVPENNEQEIVIKIKADNTYLLKGFGSVSRGTWSESEGSVVINDCKLFLEDLDFQFSIAEASSGKYILQASTEIEGVTYDIRCNFSRGEDLPDSYFEENDPGDEVPDKVEPQSIEDVTVQEAYYFAGEFVFEDVSFLVYYTDGSSKEFRLTKEMVQTASLELLETPGVHQIEFEAEGLIGSFEVEILPSLNEDEIDTSPQEIVYDGNPHKYELTVPSGFIAEFSSDDSFTNVGEYTTTVIIREEKSGITVLETDVTLRIKPLSVAIPKTSATVPFEGKRVDLWPQDMSPYATLLGERYADLPGVYHLEWSLLSLENTLWADGTIENKPYTVTVENKAFDPSDVVWETPLDSYVYREYTFEEFPYISAGIDAELFEIQYNYDQETSSWLVGEFQVSADIFLGDSWIASVDGPVIKVEPQKFNSADFAYTTEYEYNGWGEDIAVEYDMPAEWLDYVEVQGDLRQWQVGVYAIRLVISQHNGGIVWEDGSWEDRVVQWEIVKKQTEIQVDDGDFGEMFEFEYDGNDRWLRIESDFIVAVTINGKEQTAYQKEFNFVEPGEYRVTFRCDDESYRAEDKEYTIIILRKDLTPSEEDVIWNYTAGSFVYSGLLYQVQVEHIDGLEAMYTANEATDAGDYTAIVRFRLGGMDEKYYFVDSDKEYSLQWSIAPKRVHKPDLPNTHEFEYSENGYKLFEYSYEGVRIEGDSAKEIGNYTAVLSLLNGNYIWEDGTNEPISFEWSIGKKVIIILAGFDWLKLDYYQTGYYSGGEQGYILQDESRLEDYYILTYSDNRKTLPGQYVAKAILQSRYDSEIYELRDGKGNVLNSEVTLTMDWEIKKGDVQVPEKTSFRYVYNGTPQSLAFREYDEARIRFENNVQTNAGAYEVRACIKEPDLYTFRVNGEELDSISFEFVINKATPNFSSVAPEVVSFDGNTYLYEFEVLAGGPKYTVQYLYGTSLSEGADEERISVDGIRNAGNYIVVFSLEESDNYLGYEKKYNFVLYKRYFSGFDAQWSVQDYTYDGISRTVVIENLTEDAQVEYTGNVLLNATIYNVKAVIRETQNYMQSELSTTISVNPLIMQLPQVTIPSAVYDGTEKSCSWDINGLTAQGTVSAVNAGQYWFKLFAKNNYKFAEEDGYLLQGGFRKSYVEYSWEIAKADYDFGNAHWTYESPLISDGTYHHVFIDGLNDSLRITYGGTTYAYASGDYVATATISGFDSDNYNTPELLDSLKTLQWSIANAREGDYEYYAQDGNNAVLVDYFGNTPEVVLPTTVNGLKVFKIEPGLFEGHSEILSLDARSFALNKGALASLMNLRSLTTLRLNYKLSELFSVTGGSAPESLKALHLAQLYTYENFGPMLDAPALRELYFSGGTAQVGNYVELGGHSSPLRLIEVRNANPSRFTVYCGSAAAANFYSIVRVYEGNVEYKRGDHTLTGNVDYTIEIGKTTWAGNFYYSLDEDAKTATVLSFNGESDVLRLQPSVYINGATYAIEGYVEGALEKHAGVERIVIDAGVAELPSGAFRGYTAARTLEAGTLPTVSRQLEKLFGKIPDALSYVHFLSGCEVNNECLYGSRVTKIEVDDGVVVNSGAFSNAEYLEQAILPSSLTVLPSMLFSDDINLTTVSYSHALAEIGSDAFYGCISLTEMPSSASLTHVGDRAFYGCESLTKLPAFVSLTYIEDKAFAYTGLTEVTIPYSLEGLGEAPFYGCSSLAKVYWNAPEVVSENNAFLTGGAFYGVQNVSSVVFGDSVKTIPAEAFRGCGSLESITFGSSVSSIGASAFVSNVHLTRITLPRSLSDLSEFAFSACYNLVEIVNLSGLNFMPGEWPFYYAKRIYTDEAQSSCIALDGQGFLFYEDDSERILLGYKGSAAEITLPSVAEKPYTINPYAFAYNATITAVTVPEGITELKEGVFYGCVNLQSLTLPASLTAIGANAHTGCPNLETVRFNGTIEQWLMLSRDCTKSTNDNPYDLYCNGTKVTHIELRSDMTVRNTLRSVRSLTSVTLGQGLQSVPAYMFMDCLNLKTMQFSSGLVTINKYAFYGCEITGNLLLPQSLEYLGDYAFYGCEITGSLVLPQNLEYLGGGVFSRCELLQSVEFSSALLTGWRDIFSGCTGLQSVIFAPGMTEVYGGMFKGCESLLSVELPDSITSIGSYAFYGCAALVSLKLPDSVTSIGSDAFYGCSSLTSIEIPGGVSAISGSMFSNCSSLVSIVLPENITTIDINAFWNCRQLSYVYYKGTAEDWAKIEINEHGNDTLYGIIYYYIEHAEDVPADGGNYWHYAEDGKTPIVWTIEETIA